MSKFNLDSILRENIKNLVPYSSARDEFKGTASVLLDANENSFGSPLSETYNRYPDPLQIALKDRISKVKGVPSKNMFLGNGSDEAIDILIRAFCRPRVDNILILPPTYGMYEVSASINDVAVKKVNLDSDFQLNLDAIDENIDENTKIIFICSPNNPTGNSIFREDIETIMSNFKGLVVVDEAYINYSRSKSFIQELTEYSNLVVLQTFSKAWGMAGLRLGMAFASEEIIEVFNKVKPPYNVNQATQTLALEALEKVYMVNNWIRDTVKARGNLSNLLEELPFVDRVFPSDANFILVKTDNANAIYDYLASKGIVVRNRSKVELCDGCLRITIGTPEENQTLLNALKEYSK
ncbi:MAG TPA: histidinol-phosphate transaminase [Sphingobacteriaceae bacterium]|nr:histidinol-phosphate transaminase [Sphingobacteriaceae bacterium]